MKPAAITRVTGTERPDGRCFSLAYVAALTGLLAAAWAGTADAQEGATSRIVGRPTFTPSIRAAAVYSDNIRMAPDGQERSDVLLEVSPSISAISSAPRASYNVFYQMRNLWLSRDGETSLFRHSLQANGSFAVVDDRMWVDLTGYMGTVNASALGPIAEDPGSSLVNTSRLRRFSISPWYRDRIGNFAAYTLRYYAAHTGGGNDFALAKLDQGAQAAIDGIATGTSPWNWRWNAEYQRRDFDGGISRDRRRTGATLFYRVTTDLRLFGTVDYEQFEGVFNRSGDDNGWGPGAGFSWNPGPRMNVAASVSRRYYGTIGNARFAYSTPGSVGGLQYSRAVLTSSEASLLMFDPDALTSVGLESVNPVLDGLINLGLPVQRDPTMTQALVTDAAVHDRRVTAFYGLRGSRNALTLSGFLSNRQSTAELGPTTTVTGILGNSVAGGVFEGELQERGLAANYVHRLDARASVSVTLEGRTNYSPTAGFETRMATLRAGYGLQLTGDTALFAGVRRTRQTADGAGAASYNENAIYGGLDMRFR